MVHEVAMPYDAYGLGFGRISAKTPGKLRILLLGNSACEMWPTAHAFKELSDKDPRGVEIVNLAQAGAGIADHVVQGAYAMAQDAQPDMVVLTVGSFSFGDLGFVFNTECESVPFEPSVSKWLTSDFYRHQYDVHSAVDAVIGAALPLKQLDPIIRNEQLRNWPQILQRRLDLPRLNWMAAQFDEYYRRGSVHQGAAWLERPLRNDYAARCDEILEMFSKAHIPVLVIREPCMHYAMSDAVSPYLKGLESRWPNVRFVDLEGEWRQDEFMDQIHPLMPHAPAYAKRQYDLMIEQLTKYYPAAMAGNRS
jgi:hypothetical protein